MVEVARIRNAGQRKDEVHPSSWTEVAVRVYQHLSTAHQVTLKVRDEA